MAWEWRQGLYSNYLTIPGWEKEGIQIGFSSRQGGISNGPYRSLNLGLHVGDRADDVLMNRQRWLAEWGADWPDFTVGEQVHGSEVIWIKEEDGGKGSRELSSAIPGVDGLLTKGNLGLMAFFADCVPLFFYHPVVRAVGIAHAGWKGTAAKIGLKVLALLTEAGGDPADCWVGIGPGIGPCCYEVDERVTGYFRFNCKGDSLLKPVWPGHYQLDLWQANMEMLQNAGIRRENISLAGICTSCRAEEFFSHRRDGVPTGRMAGWIRQKEA